MKIQFLLLFLTLFVITNIQAQTTSPVKYYFCKDKDTINYDEFLRCGQLTCSNKDVVIESFVLSVTYAGLIHDTEEIGAKLTTPTYNFYQQELNTNPKKNKSYIKTTIHKIKVKGADAKDKKDDVKFTFYVASNIGTNVIVTPDKKSKH